ncbi:glycogen debranching N-terminal domain-containing protein [Cryobacterium sp. Y62]|uniref:glycogen debranching N-terminal domain-containing protein n=1 Tax=Cryobacterium sp. Y62 TaxID=2048284 RepID=UPI000CE56786|nr:glycogen debranching N-terminal domain-containing protein [Cryobacterium sp. Y62]
MPDPAARSGVPMLNNRLVLLAAPTQVWSEFDGTTRPGTFAGLYHGDWRIATGIELTIDERRPEPLGLHQTTARAVFTGVCPHLDDTTKDPRVVTEHTRAVRPGGTTETVQLVNATSQTVRTEITLAVTLAFASLDLVRAGNNITAPFNASWQGSRLTITQDTRTLDITADDGVLQLDGDRVTATWPIAVEPGNTTEVQLDLAIADTAAVTAGTTDPLWAEPEPTGNLRLDRWVSTASADLTGLRMVATDHPDEPFLAAGAPWYLTLFGRDSITAARLLLPLGTDLALGTLSALARRQGTKVDPIGAEAPGKILHELRAAPLRVPREGIVLPPVYYGSIDATTLWICLLHDTWQAGVPAEDLRSLLPSLLRALSWLRDSADSDGDGFLEYIDLSGRGLANQGWKDSIDAVRHHDGTRAEGPIALCEAQAYACEAALGAAALLDAFKEPGADEWLAYAGAIRSRFRAQFWVERDGLRFPAIALDGAKRPVASVSSNIGLLLGTGLLDADEERLIADLLLSDRMASGFGVRTLSADEAGYWRLSYHCGSVWPHDTAIIISGLMKAGFGSHARTLAGQLLDAAERFDYHIPELYSGDAEPIAYPTACRPQAWSATAFVPVWQALVGPTDVESQNSRLTRPIS